MDLQLSMKLKLIPEIDFEYKFFGEVRNFLQDVQNFKDDRGIEIQRVGVTNLTLPFLIKTFPPNDYQDYQSVTAQVRFTVSLPQEFKGTHMSRFIEILLPWCKKPIAESELESILREACEKLQAQSAQIRLSFKYFVEKSAPVSQKKSLLDLDCYFEATLDQKFKFELGVEVPFTSLCPCSKEISRFGAHNQRSIARVSVRFKDECISIEDLSALIESQGSQPIYPLLKREDEKFVTEAAYQNPKFVEDILRDLILALRQLKGIEFFSIECENFESIHHHNAFASHKEEVN